MRAINSDFYHDNKQKKHLYIILGFLIILMHSLSGCQTDPGQFAGETMVGRPGPLGKVVFNQPAGSYQLTAGGENIWGDRDEFYYVWKKVSGDLKISADIKWLGKGKNAHRKAGLMIRQGLDADDPYVDAIVHGDGLISLQYRNIKGGPTREIKAPGHLLPSLLFERAGDLFSLSLGRNEGGLSPVGSITIQLTDPVYIGLALCAHDTSALETAVFNSVNLDTFGVVPDTGRTIESSLEILNINTGERTVTYRAIQHLEAPNWSRDGNTLVYNSAGKLFRIPVDGGIPEPIQSGDAINCNNDHGFSENNKTRALILARLVTGWEDPGLLCRAKRRI